MSRRSRKSKRKLNSLFIMLLLTGMLLLTSTYAWFSSSKEVALEGINAKVVAAEGLQISLDAVTWSSSITINQANLAAANNYRWPEALTPVSTTGATSSGNLDMFWGEISSDGTTLSNAAQESDTTTSKYIVFDLYFKNASSQAAGDNLQLNSGTSVAIASDGQSNTGLENSVRAAVVLWSNTAAMTASPADARAIAFGTPKVTIWEPNYSQHIAEVASNDASRATANFVTKGLLTAGTGTLTGVNSATAVTDVTADQATLRTGASVGSPINMTHLTTTTDGSAGDNLKLAQNSIMKARVYIWLEGQDPDCIDTASTGKSIDIVLGFTKPAPNTSSSSGT